MFDYDINIRKIHEICNKIYKKDGLGHTRSNKPLCPSLSYKIINYFSNSIISENLFHPDSSLYASTHPVGTWSIALGDIP